MDRSKLEHIDAIYQCARATCVGAVESKLNMSCWNRKAFAPSNTSTTTTTTTTTTSSECDSDALQCLKGSRSILCGSCEQGYLFSGSANACVACESNQNLAPMAIAAGLCLVLAAALLFWVRGHEIPPWLVKHPPLSVERHV